MNQPRRIQGEIDMDILAPIGEKQARMKPPLVLAYCLRFVCARQQDKEQRRRSGRAAQGG